VPNSRSEVASVDQNPCARRTITLADSPRLVEIGITPHTQRFKVDDVNAGLVYVFQCQPLPEPGTLFIDYWSLGQRYTLTDDGAGQLTGAGGGVVSYLTGAVNLTLKAVPDIGSAIALSHGARLAYTDRKSQGAAVRAPEYCWVIEGDTDADSVVPGSVSIGYTSAGVLYAVGDDGHGQLTGAASGRIDYSSRTVLLRPAYMPDPGAELLIDCQLDELFTEIIPAASTTPDLGGFIAFGLAHPPAPGSLSVQFAVTRQTSATSGATLTTTTASKNADNGSAQTARFIGPVQPPAVLGLDVNFPDMGLI